MTHPISSTGSLGVGFFNLMNENDEIITGKEILEEQEILLETSQASDQPDGPRAYTV